MPRHLFIASIFCCLLASLFAGAEAVGELREVPFRFALNRHLGSMYPIGGSFALATLVFAVPIAAIFLRMSSLLAARNLFDAFASFCSTACATLALIFFSIVQLRIAVGGSTSESVATDVAAMAALAELNTVAFYLFGFFLSLTLLTLRPYFLIRSSRTLAVMVSLPLPLYLLLVGQQIANWFGGAGVASAPASILYFAVLTFIFVAIPIHSFRHRHFFLEATNLRELLDPRHDPSTPPRADVGFRGGVAFDA
jgi:hypothetical protein